MTLPSTEHACTTCGRPSTHVKRHVYWPDQYPAEYACDQHLVNVWPSKWVKKSAPTAASEPESSPTFGAFLGGFVGAVAGAVLLPAEAPKERTRTRVLLVGEAPKLATDPPLARRTQTRRRLRSLTSLDDDEFDATFEACNLFSQPTDPWPPREAAEHARDLDLRGRVAVLLGARVAAAFGLRTAHDPLRRFRWYTWRGGVVAVVPHPSRASRLWNRVEVRDEAREFLSAIARGWYDPVDPWED